MKAVPFLLLFCAASLACAQSPVRPVSLDFSPGVHLYSYDGAEHRSAAHYLRLCEVVLKEFNVALPVDSVLVILVFVDSETQERLSRNNLVRFQYMHWYGVSIEPALILMDGGEESDDTFMHEYMHLLHHQGRLFRDTSGGGAHLLIKLNEGLLLGSKSYLEYLKTRPR
jgi:hypothetical protein